VSRSSGVPATCWRLRRAGPPDGDAVASLFSASFALLDFLPRLHTPAQDRAFFRKIVVAERVTVAESDAGIVGFISETDGWVSHLYVHPGHLRSGIGRALLRSAQGRQRSLRLWCFQKNRRGRRFYEANGFTPVELTDGSRNEEGEPDILYAWQTV